MKSIGFVELFLFFEVLRIFNLFVCKNGIVVGGMKGLCIFFKRFVYFCWLSDLIISFGRLIFEFSEIFGKVVNYIFNIYVYFF